jgi:hypothetical protein
MRMQSAGLWGCQRQSLDLLAHIPRDELDRGLHFRNYPLGFLETFQAGLAEPFLLRNGADRVDVALDIPGNALPVATHAALQVDNVVGVADGADTLDDLRALCAEALVLVACCVHLVFDLLQARGSLRGAARATRDQLVVSPVEVLVHPRERLFRLGDSFVGSPLLHGHWSGDGLAQFMLHMEEIRRVMRPQVVFNIGEKARGLIACRLDDVTVEAGKGRRHQCLPGVLISCRCQLF